MPAAPRSSLVMLAALVALAACGASPATLTPRLAPAPPAAILPSGPASTPAPRPEPQADLAARVDALFAPLVGPDGGGPGCAVGVYRAGDVVFSRGYGRADVEHGAPMTDDTPVYTASLSKQFTAAAVLLLAADGKLSLDDDVHKYIPELGDFGGQRITIGHLLHHTSGLRDYHLLLLLAGLDEEDVITRREVLWLISHQRTLNFPPGRYISYSSSGYVLAAEIVRRVSGESFGAFLSRRVLVPLGMTKSLVREDHALPIAGRAIGYGVGPDKHPRTWMGNLEYDGSSNLVTTTRDLAKWDGNFYAPTVGGQAMVDAMRVRGQLADGTVLDYAMGLEEIQLGGRAVEWHDGGFAGYRSALGRYLDERLTVSILCNTTEADADGLAEKVAEIFLPKRPAPPPAAAPVALAASSAPVASFGADLQAVAGTYIDRSGGEVRMVDVSGRVARMRYGHSTHAPRELVPVGPGDLQVKGGTTRYRFTPADGTHPARITRLVKSEMPIELVRDEVVDRADHLADYAGLYGSAELPHDLEIRVEDGSLVAGPVGGAARTGPFKPLARDLFLAGHAGDTDDIGWRFERDAHGKIVRLVVSDDRAREVALVRRR